MRIKYQRESSVFLSHVCIRDVFFSLISVILNLMCMGLLPACMFAHHLCAVPTEAGRGHLFPWGLKLQTFVSHSVGASDPAQVL